MPFWPLWIDSALEIKLEILDSSIGSNDFEWKLQSEGRCWHFSKWRLMTDKLVVDEKSQLAGSSKANDESRRVIFSLYLS